LVRRLEFERFGPWEITDIREGASTADVHDAAEIDMDMDSVSRATLVGGEEVREPFLRRRETV